MRCHAAEPGAVPSTILEGFTNPSYGWRTGRSVGGPQGPLPGRREARLYGPDERAGRKSRLDHGCESTQVRFGRTARYRQNTAVERRLARRPDRKGRRLTFASEPIEGAPSGAPLPLSCSRERGKRSKVRPGIG